MAARSAADLPVGSTVYHRGVDIERQHSDDPAWIGEDGEDGETYSHADIDTLLADRAFITFVPTGRGRWLAKEREQRCA